MNKEQQELLYEVYGKALLELAFDWLPYTPPNPPLDTIESFINKCKTDTEFSERWGLKIEERELIQGERLQLLWKVCREENIPPDSKELDDFWLRYNEIMSKYSIPTRIITITYNNKTIESYE